MRFTVDKNMAILPHCLNIIRCNLSSIHFQLIGRAQRRSHRWNCICAAWAPIPGLSRCTALSPCHNSRGRGSQHHVSRAMAVSARTILPWWGEAGSDSRAQLLHHNEPRETAEGLTSVPECVPNHPDPVCRTDPFKHPLHPACFVAAAVTALQPYV